MNIFGRKVHLLEIVIAGLTLLLILLIRKEMIGIVVDDKDGCEGRSGFRELPPVVTSDVLALRELALQKVDLRPYTSHKIRCERYVWRDDVPPQTSPVDGLRVVTGFLPRKGNGPPRGGIYQILLKYSSEKQAAEAFESEASTHIYRRDLDDSGIYSFQQAAHDCGLDSEDFACEIVTQYGQYVSIIYLDVSGLVRPAFEDLIQASDLRLRHLSQSTTDDG